MITVTEYSGECVGVFGLGKAGEAAVASLLAGGARVYAWDDSEASCAALAAVYSEKITLSPIAEWPWEKLKALVLSPGVPLTHAAPAQARQANCSVIGEVELLARAQPAATYVGVTGTNGKSTTTTLIAHILKACGRRVEAGGNLGTPALALAPLGEGGIYVIEMSSYQLELVKTARFNVAVLLNLTPDHLDRHGDMAGYLAAKLHIFDRQQAVDTAVIAVDDAYTQAAAENARLAGRVVNISARRALEKGVYVEDGVLHDAAQHFDLSAIATLLGRHNWQNAAAAYAACRAVACAPEAIFAAMQYFPGLAHRMEPVADIGGVRFVNDSKATNADAAACALAAYAPIYWIVGGKPKAGGIGSLADYFPRIAHAFLIGEAADEFARTLEGRVAYTYSRTLDVAVQQAAEMAAREARAGAVVLLSPACASFDQFANFEARGEAFRAAVSVLAARHAA